MDEIKINLEDAQKIWIQLQVVETCANLSIHTKQNIKECQNAIEQSEGWEMPMGKAFK